MKKEYEKRLTDHLIKTEQIKLTQPESSKKLTQKGKEALGEYLTKTGQIKE